MDKSSSTQSESIRINERERTFLVHLPEGKHASPLPLIIALHGGGGRGRGTEKITNLSQLSDQEGFMVVYPDGIGRTWNDGRRLDSFPAMAEQVDDVGFIERLIDYLVERHAADSSRVYVTGISNGGHMSHRLGVELSHRIAAIAPVAATMPTFIHAKAAPEHPIGVIAFFGVEDPMNWWQGGGRAGGESLSVPEVMTWWARHNGCGSDPDIRFLPNRIEDGTRIRREYYPCERAEVVLYAIEGGGHTWPDGLQYMDEAQIGKTTRNLNANKVMWEHFKQHRRQ